MSRILLQFEQSLRFIYISLALVLSLLSPLAFAETADVVAKHTAFVTTTPEAHRYADQLVAEIQKKKIPLNKAIVELYHIGEEIPDSLKALTRCLYFSGIKTVYFRQISLEQYEQTLDAQTQRIEENAPEVFQLLKYQLPDGHPVRTVTPQSFRQRFHTGVEDTKIRLRHFFGVPKGVTILSYYFKKDTRPWKETLVEGGTAFAKTAVGSYVLFHTLVGKGFLDPISVIIPIVISAGATIFFDYMPRDNMDCKAQGMNFNFRYNRFEFNRKLYVLISLVHSIMMRLPMMMGAHVTSAGFTLGWNGFWDKVWDTLGNSARGTTAKSPVELLLQKARQYIPLWASIGAISAWGIFYSAITLMDLFHYSDALRSGLFYGAIIGLGLDLFVKNRSDLPEFFRKILRKIRGKKNNCQTLLKVREIT